MPARASTFCNRSPSCSPKVLGSLTCGLLCRARLRSSTCASYSRGRAGAEARRLRALGAPLPVTERDESLPFPAPPFPAPLFPAPLFPAFPRPAGLPPAS